EAWPLPSARRGLSDPEAAGGQRIAYRSLLEQCREPLGRAAARVCTDYGNAFDMTGSVTVITGGARGIGFEPATARGAWGAKIVLACRNRSALDAAVKRLAETGVNAAYTVLDATIQPPSLKLRTRSRRSKARSTSSSIAPASPGSIQHSKRLATNGVR